MITKAGLSKEYKEGAKITVRKKRRMEENEGGNRRQKG